GGKVDTEDSAEAWASAIASGRRDDRAQRIAACREALEEAAILPIRGGTLAHAALLDLRAKKSSLLRFLAEEGRGLLLDLDALVPFARWVTPTAEARRYDTRFYLTRLPEGQE